MDNKKLGCSTPQYPMHSVGNKPKLLQARFAPEKNEAYRSALFRNTRIFGWPSGEEYPFFLFRITNKNSKLSTQVVLDDQCVGRMIDMLDDEEKKGWVRSAANFFYAKEQSRIAKKYQNDFVEGPDGLLQCKNAQYHKEHIEIDLRYKNRDWIPQSCDPLGIAEFSSDQYPGENEINGKAGAMMTIYYQPNIRPNERSKKPWLIEIKQYILCLLADGSFERKNERMNNIRLSSDEFNEIINKILIDAYPWTSRNSAITY